MLLISATPSPFARKVRIAMLEKGIPFEIKNEIPWHSDTETPLYNPLEQLPILLTDGDEAVYESSHILEWLEYTYPETPLLPADVPGILAAKKLQVVCEGILDAGVLLFWEMAREHQSLPWSQRQLRKIVGGLRELDRQLQGRSYAVGDSFTLADICIVAALGMMDQIIDLGLLTKCQEILPAMGNWRELYPGMAGYFTRMHDRPSVRETGPVMFALAEQIV